MVCRFLIGEETNTQRNQTFRRLKKNRVRACFWPLHLQPDKITAILPQTLDGLKSLLGLHQPPRDAWPAPSTSLHDVIFLAKKHLHYLAHNQVELPPWDAFTPQPPPDTDPDGKFTRST